MQPRFLTLALAAIIIMDMGGQSMRNVGADGCPPCHDIPCHDMSSHVTSWNDAARGASWRPLQFSLSSISFDFASQALQNPIAAGTHPLSRVRSREVNEFERLLAPPTAPPDASRWGVNLKAYLENLGNTAEDAEKAAAFFNGQNSSPLLLELGAGRGKTVYELAAKNPNIRFLAADRYDRRYYHLINEAWRGRRLSAQLRPLDNLVLVRSHLEIFQYLPDHCLDYLLLVNSDPDLMHALANGFAGGELMKKMKPGGQIVVKPYEFHMANGPLFGFDRVLHFSQTDTVFLRVDLDTHSDFSVTNPGSSLKVAYRTTLPAAPVAHGAQAPIERNPTPGKSKLVESS